MIEKCPETIAELRYMLDKRLSLLEETQKLHWDVHASLHTELGKTLGDHEQRIRTGMTLNGLLSSAGGLLAIIAIIKSFFIK